MEFVNNCCWNSPVVIKGLGFHIPCSFSSLLNVWYVHIQNTKKKKLFILDHEKLMYPWVKDLRCALSIWAFIATLAMSYQITCHLLKILSEQVNQVF